VPGQADGTKDRSDGRSCKKSPEPESMMRGKHLTVLKMGISALRRAGGGIKLL
jgi:hypothetical protein